MPLNLPHRALLNAKRWSPRDVTSATLLGLWNFHDAVNCYFERDYAGGITPCVAGDYIGVCRDTSGNNRHLVAPGDTARAIWSGGAAVHDGSNDGYDTQAVMPNTVHLYLVGNYKLDTSFTPVHGGGTYWISAVDGISSTPFNNAGTPTLWKDGAQITPLTTRDHVRDAMADDLPHVFEWRNIDTSTWGGNLKFNDYTGFANTVYQYAIVAFSAVLSAEERDKMITWGQDLYT